jgi:hypothetical protein
LNARHTLFVWLDRAWSGTQNDDLDPRLNVILTLLLTEIAFKFIIAESIPKVAVLMQSVACPSCGILRKHGLLVR